MLRSSDRRLVLLALFVGALAFADGRAASVVIGPDGKPMDYPYLEVSTSGGSTDVGAVHNVGFDCVRNKGKMTIRIPAPSLGYGEGDPLISLRVTNEDGAEAVTYLSGRRRPKHPRAVPHTPPVLVIEPGDEIVLAAAVVPWSGGKHRYTIQLSNTITKRYVSRWVTTGFPGLEPVQEPIPNVWVGTLKMEGSFFVREWASAEADKTLAGLRMKALDKGAPLRERCAAIASMVNLRHVYATDALMAVEKETRKDRIMHPQVVKALYDITYHGTGYRAVQRFAELALKRDVHVAERALCIDVLTTFATWKHLKHDGRIIHVVTREETKAAQTAIQKLKARITDEPEEIQQLLRRAPDPPEPM